MTKPKKLIEVAMPVKEISAGSVRDKSIRHGHISTLHLWWARRPLPVCRAVVFASLVPDPLDENCPQQFKEAVEILLGKSNDLPGDPYKPYDDIPYTAIVDKMEDNLRNRLMMFIGKFSDTYVTNEKNGKKTPAKEQLHPYSLIKWDNKNNEAIIGRARQLIFVSHNASTGKSSVELLMEYNRLNEQIEESEQNLYSFENRHLESERVIELEQEKEDAIASFLTKMPRVFDPFAGGGAIPLEAARLGCNSFGNDINPVAHIIQRGSCEFPQKYGKPILYSRLAFIKKYGNEEYIKQKSEGNIFSDSVKIPNRLAHDFEYLTNKIIKELATKSSGLFPEIASDKRLLGYIWTKKTRCPNPSCNTIIPLLSNRELCKRTETLIDFKLIDGELIPFLTQTIENYKTGPTYKSSKLSCPVCGSVSDSKYVKKQSFNGHFEDMLLAVIYHDGKKKIYEEPKSNSQFITKIQTDDFNLPNEEMTIMSDLVAGRGWNYKKWVDLFNHRQLSVLSNYISITDEVLKQSDFSVEYKSTLRIYCSLLLGKLIDYYSMFCRWAGNREEIKNVYSRQAIAMIFDSAETYPFSDMMGSIQNHQSWILRYLNSESQSFISSQITNSVSGEKSSFDQNSLDAIITDPPYYDSIAYSDISDYFYVWHKIMLKETMPLNFAFPLTPKKEECTALKHHQIDPALHFETLLQNIFKSIEIQTKPDGVISIMFAHQTTKAWKTLCNSILDSNMNLTGSWALDSEYSFTGLKQNKAFLSSSVTVSCVPFSKEGVGDSKEIKREIKKMVSGSIKELYALGFRGADLLTACFGKAVSVFGRFERVEKSDGSNVDVEELLEFAREAAFNSIVSEIKTDDYTKFYIGWLNLFGFSENSHDDVGKIVKIGLSINYTDVYNENIIIKDGDKGVLGSMKSRVSANSRLGLRPINNNDIDIAHRLMYLFDPSNASRSELLDYISDKAPSAELAVWRVLNSLAELLPKSKDINDYEFAIGLLQNQENLLREAKNREDASGVQTKLGFD